MPKPSAAPPPVVQPIRIYRPQHVALAREARRLGMPVAAYLRRVLEDHARKLERAEKKSSGA